MERSKATLSSLKRIQPRRRILDGLAVVECKICKARFKSLMPLSQHVIALHQLKLSFKNRRKQKNNVHNRFSGRKARNEDAVEVQEEEEEEEEEDDDDDDDEDDDDDDEDEDEDDEDDGVDDEVEGNKLWFTDESLSLNCQLNANAALNYLNEQVGGKRYELVEHGPAMATNPAIEHINFKAKEKDCLDAPVETFFAQMSSLRGMVVDCWGLVTSYHIGGMRTLVDVNYARV